MQAGLGLATILEVYRSSVQENAQDAYRTHRFNCTISPQVAECSLVYDSYREEYAVKNRPLRDQVRCSICSEKSVGCLSFATYSLCPCVCVHRRKVTQDFSTFLLRCLPLFLSREGFSLPFPSSTVKSNFVYPRINRSPLVGHVFFWVNDTTGYTLVKKRHSRVPTYLQRETDTADWLTPTFTLPCE